MQSNGIHIFTWANFSTILDVLIIWFLVYHLVILIRGTKAVQLAKGIVLIFVVRIVNRSNCFLVGGRDYHYFSARD